MSLRIAVVSATSPHARDAQALQRRAAIGRDAIALAADEGAKLVVFPAGFLWARSRGTVLAAADTVLRGTKASHTAVAIGVDVRAGKHTPGDGRDRRGILDNWCVAASPGRVPAVWCQRSSTWKNGFAVSDVAPRVMTVAGFRVEVLICGEIFSRPIRVAVANRSADLALVAVPAHTAVGSRHARGLVWFASAGLPTARAVHAAHPQWLRQDLWLPSGERAHRQPRIIGNWDRVCVSVYEIDAARARSRSGRIPTKRA